MNHLPFRRLKLGAALAALLPALLGAIGCAGRSAQAPEATRSAASAAGFTLLQINDAYKIEGLEAGRVGGMARVRTLRQRLEADGRPVLVLHAGDLLSPSVASKYLAGAQMIDVLNDLDGDDGFDPRLVATLGNHEFDQQELAVLLERLDESRFRWVSSNVRIRPAPGSAAEPLASRSDRVFDTLLLDLGGIRVGIFGLTLDDVSRDWLEVEYRDVEARYREVRRAIADLQAGGAEYLIALTHQELGEDLELARDFPEIDRIVGGHEHIFLERKVGDVWITKADADAKSAVVIDVERTGSGFESRHRKVDLVGEAVPADPGVLGRVATWLVRLEEVVEAKTGRRLLDVVAITEHALEGVEPAIRGRETALGDFLADVLRARLATDVAFINGGAIRVNDDVPAGGDVRVYELEGIFYYDNRPVAFEITGAELLELLRKSVTETRLGHGRFLQVSGIRFRYRAWPVGEDEATRIDPGDVEVLDAANGEFVPLELDRTYSAASLDYLWKNGFRDGYPLFSEGAGRTSPPLLPRPELSWRGITEEAIAALPGRRIRTDIDGRIERREIDAPSGDGESE